MEEQEDVKKVSGCPLTTPSPVISNFPHIDLSDYDKYFSIVSREIVNNA